MSRLCVDCSGVVPAKCPGPRCWKCRNAKYRTPKGFHGPHHCNYCGEVGHNILTCRDRIEGERA